MPAHSCWFLVSNIIWYLLIFSLLARFSLDLIPVCHTSCTAQNFHLTTWTWCHLFCGACVCAGFLWTSSLCRMSCTALWSCSARQWRECCAGTTHSSPPLLFKSSHVGDKECFFFTPYVSNYERGKRRGKGCYAGSWDHHCPHVLRRRARS